jgi:hypothetical protein
MAFPKKRQTNYLWQKEHLRECLFNYLSRNRFSEKEVQGTASFDSSFLISLPLASRDSERF